MTTRTKTTGQYYRDSKQYLIRLYCTGCGSEMIYTGKTDDKYNYACKGCDGKEITTIEYPYWHKSKSGVK